MPIRRVAVSRSGHPQPLDARSPTDPLRFCIERATLENGRFDLTGWAFRDAHAVNGVELRSGRGRRDVCLPIAFGLPRQDVEAAFGLAAASHSGFEATVELSGLPRYGLELRLSFDDDTCGLVRLYDDAPAPASPRPAARQRRAVDAPTPHATENELETVLGQALTATANQAWPEAIACWARARERFPNVPAGYAGGGFAHLQHGDLGAAEALLADAVGRFPDDAATALQYAEVATRREDWAEARRRWAIVRERFPHLPAGFVRGAVVCRRAADRDGADAILDEAVGRFPTDPGIVFQRIDAAIERRDWSEADRRCDEARARVPDKATGYVRSVVVKLQLGEAAAAEALAAAARRRFPADARVAFQWADVATTRSEWPSANGRWETVRSLFPHSPTAFLRSASALLQQGRVDAAEMLLTEATACFPWHAPTVFEHAEMATRRKEWPEADRRWTVARERFPDRATPYLRGGHVKLHESDLGAADTFLRETVRRFPGEPTAAFQFADAATRRRDWAEASRRWASARERFPNEAVGYLGSSAAALSRGDAEGAKSLLMKAAELTEADERAPAHQYLEVLIMVASAGFEIEPNFVRKTANKLSQCDELAHLPQETRALSQLGASCPEFGKKALFISGAPRSGTTALAYLLNLHPKISIFNERYTYQYGYHPMLLLDGNLFPDGWQNNPFALQWNILREKTRDSTYIGDKRPNFFLSWLITRENFASDQINVIHLYRPIEEIAASYNARAARAAAGEDLGWDPAQNFVSACHDFNANNRALVNVLEDDKWKHRVFLCNYSSVFTKREICVELFKWLNLEIDSNLETNVASYLMDASKYMLKPRLLPRHQIDYLADHVDWAVARQVLGRCR